MPYKNRLKCLSQYVKFHHPTKKAASHETALRSYLTGRYYSSAFSSASASASGSSLTSGSAGFSAAGAGAGAGAASGAATESLSSNLAPHLKQKAYDRLFSVRQTGHFLRPFSRRILTSSSSISSLSFVMVSHLELIVFVLSTLISTNYP